MERTVKIQFFVKLDSLRLISSIAHLIDRFHTCVQSALLSAPCRCCMTALLGKAIPLWPDYRWFMFRCVACANAAFKVLVTLEWKRTWLPLNRVYLSPQLSQGSVGHLHLMCLGLGEELREQCFSRSCTLNFCLPPASTICCREPGLHSLGGRSAGWLLWQGWIISNT